MDKEVKFIDANIFLEVFLLDKNWESAKEFLEKVATGEIEAATSDFIAYSILLQIQNKLRSTEAMKNFVKFLGNMKGMMILRFTPAVLMGCIQTMEKYNLDFDDSVQASLMNAFGIKEIVSFDKDFDKVDWIKRVSPKESL